MIPESHYPGQEVPGGQLRVNVSGFKDRIVELAELLPPDALTDLGALFAELAAIPPSGDHTRAFAIDNAVIAWLRTNPNE